MNLIESLQTLAEAAPTTYFLQGRMIYPDEIFSAQGFLPLIGRMAERKLARTLEGAALGCGFNYTPFRESIFKERIDIALSGDGIHADSVRLAALNAASRDVVGMGEDGTLDLTPVYEYFNSMKQESRNALREATEECSTWPLYQHIQAS